MVYEIRVSDYFGVDSFPLGLYYGKQKNAYNKCEELNKLLKKDIYFVRPIFLQDDNKQLNNSNLLMFAKKENS